MFVLLLCLLIVTSSYGCVDDVNCGVSVTAVGVGVATYVCGADCVGVTGVHFVDVGVTVVVGGDVVVSGGDGVAGMPCGVDVAVSCAVTGMLCLFVGVAGVIVVGVCVVVCIYGGIDVQNNNNMQQQHQHQ